MTAEQDEIRGRAAERLLNDPLMIEAFESIERSIMEEWKACRWPRRRDRLWTELKLLSRVKGHLAQTIASGKLAKQQLGKRVGLLA
jgi:hypothetical protein